MLHTTRQFKPSGLTDHASELDGRQALAPAVPRQVDCRKDPTGSQMAATPKLRNNTEKRATPGTFDLLGLTITEASPGKGTGW